MFTFTLTRQVVFSLPLTIVTGPGNSKTAILPNLPSTYQIGLATKKKNIYILICPHYKTRAKSKNTIFNTVRETDKTDQTHYSCRHFVFSGSRSDDNKATAFEPQQVRIANSAHS